MAEYRDREKKPKAQNLSKYLPSTNVKIPAKR
jgi:hypothetical protein